MQILDLESLFQQLLHYRDLTNDISMLDLWLQNPVNH